MEQCTVLGGHGGVDVEIPVGVLPNSPMPLLLSKGVMKEMKLLTDFVDNKMSTPRVREEGSFLQAKESCTGHLLLPMTKKTWQHDLRMEAEDVIHVNVPSAEVDSTSLF